MTVGNLYTPQLLDDPLWVRIPFEDGIRNCIVVEVTEKEYALCDRSSDGDHFWGSNKPGVYGAGLGRSVDDPYKPARVGLLGQMAFSKVFGGQVDLVYRKGGDNYDIRLGELPIDIKCAMKNYGTCLILHTSERGKKIPLDKSYYVFSYLESEDREAKKATIVFVGFLDQAKVAQCEVREGRRGIGHLNYEVPFGQMYSMAKFVKLKQKFLDKRSEALAIIKLFMQKYKINIHDIQKFVVCPQSPDGFHRTERVFGTSTRCKYCGEWGAENPSGVDIPPDPGKQMNLMQKKE